MLRMSVVFLDGVENDAVMGCLCFLVLAVVCFVLLTASDASFALSERASMKGVHIFYYPWYEPLATLLGTTFSPRVAFLAR